MNLSLNIDLARPYNNNSQKARVLTENWMHQEIFCPSCGANICKYNNNQPASDFYCKKCGENYELKSCSKYSFGSKIVDGAYQTMIEKLSSDKNPNMCLLNYETTSWRVTDFMIIPKHFFVPEMIERRNPLSKNARRAGWVGCNILMDSIPSTGKIFYIKNREIISKAKILNIWGKTLFLRKTKTLKSKGWLLDTMSAIETLQKKEFSLNELYSTENILKAKHPDNRYVREKIRQQLQIMRDKGYLEFTGQGKYKLTAC